MAKASLVTRCYTDIFWTVCQKHEFIQQLQLRAFIVEINKLEAHEDSLDRREVTLYVREYDSNGAILNSIIYD